VSDAAKPDMPAFDPRFNKQVLFLARDGLVVIAFTGLAYLEDVPTDQWIASVVAREAPHAPQGGPGGGTRVAHPGVGYRHFPIGWLDVGQAIEALRRRASEAVRRSRYRLRPLRLTISGWQWKWQRVGGEGTSTRLRPFSASVCNAPATPDVFEVQRSPRYWGWERNKWGLQCAPKLPHDERSKLVSEIGTPRFPGDEDRVESTLVAAIRRAASMARRGVGSDCLSTLISPYRNPQVRVRYLPASPDATTIHTGWIVTPAVTQPPQEMVLSPDTSVTVSADWLNVEIDGPRGSAGPVWAMGRTQPRVPPPA
jgi:hypothetical protein